MSKASRVKKLLTCALFVVAALCAAAGRVGAQEWKAHDVPLFVSASHPLGHQGFVRVINRSDVSGEVIIDAFDDEGVPYGVPYRLVTLRIGAGETVHFNSRDLEKGNTDKGLSPGIGAGSGDWRLRLRSPLTLEVLSYNRTRDGLLAPLHDQVPSAVVRRPSTGEEATGQRVVIFNPASNVNQVSRLRIMNRGGEKATVTIQGVDDEGVSPGMAVELSVPARASRTVTSQELESGEREGLAGMLSDGQGKWQLVVTSDESIDVMSLLTSPTGHLTNLSTVPEASDGDAAAEYDVPLFPAASNADGYQGFVRIINRSGGVGEVSVEAFDDAGNDYGPVTLDIEANETVHLNSGDLEEGDPGKGLSRGIGSEGSGDWRLRLRSDLDLEVLAYNRTHDGLLTTLHDLVPYTEVVRPGGDDVLKHYVATFNPASNVNQVSRLRIINPGGEAAAVTIEGTDDAGASPGMGVELTVPAGASRTLESQELESGEWDAGSGVSGELGDGKGKWRLAVTSEQVIQVMSLLASSTGHLVNLSTAAPSSVSYANACAVAGYAEEVSFPDAVLRAEIGTVMIPVRGRAASDPIAPPDLALLRRFSAHQQGIRTLTGLECATGLESLSLGRNQITDVLPLSGLPNLRALRLYGNRITDALPLSSLPNLIRLNLSENRITDVPPLSGLPNLRDLFLSENRIADVSLSNLPNLESLILAKNQITDLSLSGLPNLESLYAQENRITGVSLSDLPNLERLDLADNQITQITDASLSGLPNLREELNLSGNRITDVSLPGLLNLESLGLGDNRITHVPPLSSLPPDLRTLNLKRNRITDVPPLSSLPANLGTLNLAWNQITDIGPFVSSAGQSGIRYIVLTGNPLSGTACHVDIPALQHRGIRVETDCY